jgi:hypothetical protein
MTWRSSLKAQTPRVAERFASISVQIVNLAAFSSLHVDQLTQGRMNTPLVEPFRYAPLPGPDYIRLAILPPNDGDAEHAAIELDIVSMRLSTVRRQYNALSYTWGVIDPDQVPPHVIMLDGRSFRIHDNLMYFLRRTRDDSQAFWIDAICIDQNNTDEKAQQIPLMRQIYADAFAVYAELGPASAVEEHAVLSMQRIDELLPPALASAGAYKTDWSVYDVVDLPQELKCLADMDSFWNTIGTLMDHPWWNRVWVMQEASVNPSRVFLLVGSAKMQLKCILMVHRLYGITLMRRRWPNNQARPRARLKYSLKILSLWDLRENNPDSLRLLDLLDVFRGSQASHSHDLLYAPLNLATDVTFDTIKVDYTMSFPELLKDVATAYLSRSDVGLDLFGFCTTASVSHSSEGATYDDCTASWVPQWEDVGNMEAWMFQKLVISPEGREMRLYNACDCKLPHSRPIFRTAGWDLILQGFPVDKITILTSPASLRPEQSAVDAVRDWRPADPNAAYIAGGTMADAFLTTLVADVSRNSNHSEPTGRGGKADWDSTKLDPAESIPDVALEEAFSLQGLQKIGHYPTNRRLATTSKGYMGLVPYQAQEGDIIYALYGGSMLYVLRTRGEKFLLIGECYVHGLMDGEAIELFNKDGNSKREVTIV